MKRSERRVFGMLNTNQYARSGKGHKQAAQAVMQLLTSPEREWPVPTCTLVDLSVSPHNLIMLGKKKWDCEVGFCWINEFTWFMEGLADHYSCCKERMEREPFGWSTGMERAGWKE